MFFLFKHYEVKSSIRIYNFPPNLLESKSATYLNKLNYNKNRWLLKSREKFNEKSIYLESSPKPLIKNYSELDLFTINTKNNEFLNSIKTDLPQWRASLGLGNSFQNQKFYQSEIFFAPKGASCLSFIPRSNSKIIKKRELWIVNAMSEKIIDTKCLIKFFNENNDEVAREIFPVRSNAANFYKIPNNLTSFDSVLFIEGMAAIPLILDFSLKDIISIEHTHPTPSFFTPNTRTGIGGLLKNLWNDKL